MTEVSELYRRVETECPAFHARVTARVLTRYYNACFRPLGITAEQFSFWWGSAAAVSQRSLLWPCAQGSTPPLSAAASRTSSGGAGAQPWRAWPGRQTNGADRCRRPADGRGHGRLGACADPIDRGSWRGGIADCGKRLVPACRRWADCGLGCLIKGFFRSLARGARRPTATHGPPLMW